MWNSACTAFIPPTSARGLGPPRSHRRRDFAQLAAQQFFAQNKYIEYRTLSNMQVANPNAFIKAAFGTGASAPACVNT
jgi:hypothetical protein